MSNCQHLRAGPWSAVFRDGDLRDLRLDGVTVISRIYPALRDEHWRTVGGALCDLQVDAGIDRFRIAYRRELRADGIAFDNAVEIEGHPDGRIAMAMRGTALCAFNRNRIGLCVLHDQGLAGAWVRIEHGDGRREETRFPAAIAPHQPFFDVAAITVRPRPGREATVRFAGEVFETEDQRNWGDASFKTYSTPLALPRPVEVAAGEVVAQRVELSLSGAGMALSAEFDPAADPALLASLGITRLRAVVAAAGDIAALRHAPLPLDVVLHGPPESWPDLAGLRLASVVAVPGDRSTTPTAWVHRLRARHPGIPVGGGNASQFTELNRGRPDGSGWDVVDFPVDPYVHADDLASLYGNVPAIAPIAATAMAIMPGAAIHVALAHGRHPGQAGRHGDGPGEAWRHFITEAAAAAGVGVLSLGPAAWLRAAPSPA